MWYLNHIDQGVDPPDHESEREVNKGAEGSDTEVSQGQADSDTEVNQGSADSDMEVNQGSADSDTEVAQESGSEDEMKKKQRCEVKPRKKYLPVLLELLIILRTLTCTTKLNSIAMVEISGWATCAYQSTPIVTSSHITGFFAGPVCVSMH